MGGAHQSKANTVGRKLKIDIEHAATGARDACHVGDVVFYDMHVWLVRDATFGRSILTLDCITQDASTNLRRVPANECVYAVAAFQPGQEYQAWRTTFATTLGHYTDVLDDAPRIAAVLAGDPILARMHQNVGKLADPIMRAERTTFLQMTAAAILLERTVPLDTLKTPRASARYRNVGQY